jgi:hypothetical protein
MAIFPEDRNPVLSEKGKYSTEGMGKRSARRESLGTRKSEKEKAI